MPREPEPADRRTPSAMVAIRTFVGLVSNSDPHDIPVGAAQALNNATPLIPGQLTVRGGTKPVQFDVDDTANPIPPPPILTPPHMG